MKSAVAIRHVAFEDAGLIAPILQDRGYALTYLEAWRDDLAPALDADLAIVLGGPIGAYEEELFPFLAQEIDIVARRLAADGPTLGVCLGSQIMAKALGSPVYPGGAQEIGWGPLTLAGDNLLTPLDGLPVLHWHGDTFDLPEGCELLASTGLYRNQAFARGRNLLALQFHIEVTAGGLEAWYVGHSSELSSLGLSPTRLREETAAHAGACGEAARRILGGWIDGL